MYVRLEIARLVAGSQAHNAHDPTACAGPEEGTVERQKQTPATLWFSFQASQGGVGDPSPHAASKDTRGGGGASRLPRNNERSEPRPALGWLTTRLHACTLARCFPVAFNIIQHRPLAGGRE